MPARPRAPLSHAVAALIALTLAACSNPTSSCSPAILVCSLGGGGGGGGGGTIPAVGGTYVLHANFDQSTAWTLDGTLILAQANPTSGALTGSVQYTYDLGSGTESQPTAPIHDASVDANGVLVAHFYGQGFAFLALHGTFNPATGIIAGVDTMEAVRAAGGTGHFTATRAGP